jgi:dTDP-4-amino-4,6-dideoxygalactose transaminase
MIMKKIPLFKVMCHDDVTKHLEPVFDSGYIGQGPKVEEFEQELGKVFDNDYVVTTNSCTSAIHLALHILKIQPGNEILTTPLTCTATNWPILAHRANIKWVDIDPKTLNVDLDDLARKITPQTKAIIVTHWGGYPVNLRRLRFILQKVWETYRIRPGIIEDCAHAFGSRFEDRPIGYNKHGSIACFSFGPIKSLTCGDGGALVLPHSDYYHTAKLGRWYGIDRNTDKKEMRCEANVYNWGYKFHMNDINATIGLGNLGLAQNAVTRAKDNAEFYNRELDEANGIEQLDYGYSDFDSSYWLYTILVEDRKGFTKKMDEHGIHTSQVHNRNDEHYCVGRFRRLLPSLDDVVGRMVCIPVGWWVSNEDREYIADCIQAGW